MEDERAARTTRQYQDLEDFCYGNPISAVVTPWQLEKLCRIFGLEPSDLTANFDGWCKHVLMSDHAVFMFPRNPSFAKVVERELAVYEQFARLGLTYLPRLIKKVMDKEISYYTFGAVTRLKGMPLHGFLRELSFEQMRKAMLELAEVVAAWHNVPPEQLNDILAKPPRCQSKRTTLDNWHRKVLCPETTEEAVDFIYRFVRRVSAGNPAAGSIAREAETKALWTALLGELAELPHVPVHGDVHEDHILVEPSDLRITGIVDWQTARIDNPVWDVNFGEWGGGICAWWDQLPALRRSMWRRYLEVRGLGLSTPEGLNLFYDLWDMIWMVYKRRDGRHPIPTGMDFSDSLTIYLRRLASDTEGVSGTGIHPSGG